MYDIVIFFVLGLGMLVVPSLTATSINGDREHGVLATLQTTLLTSADLVLGKLLAAWAISGAFLVTALPFLVWAWVEGGVPVGRILLSLVVLMLVLAVVCALGLMFSTLTARPVASAVLTYLAMGALVFGTVIGFSLTAFLVSDEETVRVHGIPDRLVRAAEPVLQPGPGSSQGADRPHARGLRGARRAPGPPSPTPSASGGCCRSTPSSSWPTRRPPTPRTTRACMPGSRPCAGSAPAPAWPGWGRPARCGEECYVGDAGQEPTDPMEAAAKSAAVWPFGLGFLLLSGAGATLLANRRLRTPVRRLPNGTRIA